MSLSEESSPSCACPPEEKKSRFPRVVFLVSLLFFLGAFFCAVFVWQKLDKNTSVLPQENSALQERITELEKRVSSLETLPPPSAVSPSSATTTLSEKQDTLKNEIGRLSEAVNVLQAETLKNAHATTSDQKRITTALVLSLKVLVETGEKFEDEWALLKQDLAQNTSLSDSLAIVAPFATQGLPTAKKLESEFTALVPQVEAALRQNEAGTWKDRIMAELRNLIRIRSTDPRNSDVAPVAAISNALAQEDLDSALEKAHLLPEAAKSLLAKWIENVAARQNVEKALTKILHQLAASDTTIQE